MGILTNIKDEKLEEARKKIVAEDRVCPTCAAPFRASASTLAALNPDLGMVMHKCPACAAEVWIIKLPGT